MIEWKKIVFVFCLALGLQGCVVIAGGAAVGAATATVVYDKRGVKEMVNDDWLRQRINKKLEVVDAIQKQCHIVVSVYQNDVLLAGQAPTEALRKQVVDVAKTAKGIRRVYDEIEIKGPTSTLTRTSDAWITSKVKADLLGAKNVNSGQFKVVTEDGTVFLMGAVSKEQADLAVDRVRQISGVQKVVKVFEYVRLAAPPNDGGAPASGADTSNAADETA